MATSTQSFEDVESVLDLTDVDPARADGQALVYRTASGNYEHEDLPSGGGGGGEYMLPIWAEENSGLANNTYEWAFGNGANTPSNHGITIYVPAGWSAAIVAMTATTNTASGSSVIEANINGALQGADCNVTLSGRSGVNDSFPPVPLSSGDRLTFRTTTAGTNSQPNIVTAWLRYTQD